jgi:glycosyltransferase involved in cell wall biosynthesis
MPCLSRRVPIKTHRPQADLSCMDVSVLIPTGGSPERLAACIAALSRQTLPRSSFEVLIGIDGPETGELEAIGSCPINFTILSFAKAGPAATRNKLIEASTGEVLVFLSDRARAEPTLLAEHVKAQAELRQTFPAPGSARRKKPALICGTNIPRPSTPERLIDRLIHTTRVIHGPTLDSDEPIDAPMLDGTFRTLCSDNLSMPAELIKRIGGFCRQLTHGEYDDAELAWRADKWIHTTVTRCETARAKIDVRAEASHVFARFITLGYEAVTLNQLSPACTIDYFGRELLGIGEQRAAKNLLVREEQDAYRTMLSLMSLGLTPVSILKPAEVEGQLKRLAGQMEIARAFLWRLGQLAALDNLPLAQALSDFQAQLHSKAKEASGVRRGRAA